MFANKQTIVDKTIVHRTRSGALISTIKSRAVYYGEKADEEERAAVGNFERASLATSVLPESRSVTSSSCSTKNPARRRSSGGRHHPAHRHPSSSARHHLQHTKHNDQSSSATEYVDPRRMGDSTVYGEEWSTSTGTVIKESRLMRGAGTASVCGAVARLDYDNAVLSLIVERINQKREASNLTPFVSDDLLRNSAREWASYLVLCGEFKVREGSTMNVWMGRTPNVGVAEEWDVDMRRWPVHIFECPQLSSIGIARAYDDARHSFIVVAEYS